MEDTEKPHVGFIRNVRNGSGWKTIRADVREMQAVDFYLRNRHFAVVSQVVQDVQRLSKAYGLGAYERSAIMTAMFEKRSEHIHVVLEHMLSLKAAMFHENGGADHE